MNVNIKQWEELMDYFANRALKEANNLFISSADVPKFIGDYMHSSVILYDTMARATAHQESLEERKDRYGRSSHGQVRD